MIERASDLDVYKAALAAAKDLGALSERCHSPETARLCATAGVVVRSLASVIAVKLLADEPTSPPTG